MSLRTEDWHSVYRNAATGWNDDPIGLVTYRVLGFQSQLDALVAALEAAEQGSTVVVGRWYQENGKPTREADFIHDAADVVALMPDHIEYDEDGNVTGTRPATASDPNFLHSYAGQRQPKKTGLAFSKAFGKGFT